MRSYNRVHIIGYQTQPVEVRQTPGGTSVTDLNLVVPYSFKSEAGQMIDGKSFHTVTLWGPMAEIAGQYLRPGAQLFISGRLQTDSWEDEKSGEKRSKTKLVGMDMILLDPKDGQHDAPGASPVAAPVNQAFLVGNATRDPEVRTTTNGNNVVSLGVATNEKWRDKASGEDKERSEFHNIVIWGELGTEVAKHIKKGSRVYVSGRVQTRSWETQTGSKRTTTEIIADQVSLLGVQNKAAAESIRMEGAPRSARSEGEPMEEPAMSVPSVNYTSEVKAEDLPF